MNHGTSDQVKIAAQQNETDQQKSDRAAEVGSSNMPKHVPVDLTIKDEATGQGVVARTGMPLNTHEVEIEVENFSNIFFAGKTVTVIARDKVIHQL